MSHFFSSKINSGYSLTELLVVTGLIGGLGVIVSTIAINITGMNSSIGQKSEAFSNLVNAHLALVEHLSQAINVGVDATLNSTISPVLDYDDNTATTSDAFYTGNGSRIINSYHSDNRPFTDTTLADTTPAAASANIDIIALFLFENRSSAGNTAADLQSDVSAAAIYFQRPTQFTTGVLYIIKIRPNTPDSPVISLNPCRNCPAGITSLFFDNLVEVHVDNILTLPNSGTPKPSGVQMRLVTRTFLSQKSSEQLWCPNFQIINNAKCPGIGPFQDHTRSFTISFRNNLHYFGNTSNPLPSGGLANTPVEERTLGPIYFFRPSF